MSAEATVLRDPALRSFVNALAGQQEGLAWLESHRPGLMVFLKALDGGPRGRQRLQGLSPASWDELFEIIASDELDGALVKKYPDVHQLFDAVKGNDDALAELRRHKPSFAALAGIIREANEGNSSASNGKVEENNLDGSAAADVGCLIGEMHLSRGEYSKAIDAFSRALETEVSADAFEGRARAYRALAAEDEARASALRGT